MPQIHMEQNISYQASLGYLPQKWHASMAGSGLVGYVDITEGDTCNFGDGCEIFIPEDIVGNFEANVLPYLTKRINEIRNLPDNWDGLGTTAPNKIAHFHAREVIEVLNELNFLPAKLMPSADEGIGFYFSNKNKYGFVECYNDGEIVVAMSDRKGFREIKEIGDTIDEIKDEIETLKNFLNAS